MPLGNERVLDAQRPDSLAVLQVLCVQPLASRFKRRRLHAAQRTAPLAPNRIHNPRHPNLRQHRTPSGPIRTFRVLRKTDISSVTNTVPMKSGMSPIAGLN